MERRIRALLIVLLVMAVCAPASAVTFNDLWMVSRVEIEIFAMPDVSGQDVGWIAVQASDGAVTLRGAVGDPRSRRLAEAAARAAGARSVTNHLLVVPTDVRPLADDVVRSAVEQALRHEPGLAGAKIRGVVRDGVVTLRGRVPDVPASALASRTVRRVAGVKAVDNALWSDRLSMLGR